MIRLYGSKLGNSSWPRVARGMAEGLTEMNRLAFFFDISEMFGLDDCVQPGHDAPMGVFIGAPNRCKILESRGDHRHRLAIVAANSSWLPEKTMGFMREHVTGFIAPSVYAREVLRTYAQDLPVYLWPHGVSCEFRPIAGAHERLHELYDERSFRVLHLASTHLERKGTRELIFAWADFVRDVLFHIRPTLTIVLDPPHDYALRDIDHVSAGDVFVRSSFQLHAPVNLSESEMRRFYQCHHVVCQPSRGEGFGLVPLEARACGIPVCATVCTGHSDHVSHETPGVVVVAHDEDGLIDDGPGAMAPRVERERILESLARCYEDWKTLSEESLAEAPRVARRWSWRAGCEHFLRKFGDL